MAFLTFGLMTLIPFGDAGFALVTWCFYTLVLLSIGLWVVFSESHGIIKYLPSYLYELPRF